MRKGNIRAGIIVAMIVILFIATITQVSTYNLTKVTNTSEWVLMFYQNGDNAISSAIEISLNLLKTVGASDQIKIAVLIDKNQVNDTKLYYFEGKTTVEQEWPQESDMSDPETLVQFCNRVMNDFPSNHYCLEITANKGSGWQGINYDDHSDGLMMTMPDIYDAFAEITDNGCMKIDVILMQSCLGGNLELRYQVNQFCEYYVSYADCGLVGDIPFDLIVSTLIDQPSIDARDLAITIVDTFTPQQIQRIYQAFGATNSVELLPLTEAIDALAAWFTDHLDTIQDEIAVALQDTRSYGLQFNIDYYIDIVDLLDRLAITDAEYNALKDHVLSCIEEAVVASVTLEGHPSCGFNMYFPKERDDFNSALRYEHTLPALYENTLFAADTQWDDFLKVYYGLEGNTAPSVPSIDGPEQGRYNEENEYLFTASDAENDDICFIVDWGDGTSDWTDLVSADDETIVGHKWNERGSYTIRAKCIDQFGQESDWVSLEISMPKYKQVSTFFKERFPILFYLRSFL